MRTILTLAACILLAPSLSGAQTTAVREWPVAAGSRARVMSPALGSEPQTGRVVAVSADTLEFRPASDAITVTIPAANIVTMQVAEGKHTRKAKGMLLGFVVGAGTGAILGAASYRKDNCTDFCIVPDSRAFDATLGGALLGIVGSAVGLIVGAHAVDTWVPVALPGR